MEILSAALSLIAIFICLIIFVPILLLIGLFFGYNKLSPQTQKIFGGLINLLKKFLKIPYTPKSNTVKNKTTKARVNKNVKVEDAEFREIKPS